MFRTDVPPTRSTHIHSPGFPLIPIRITTHPQPIRLKVLLERRIGVALDAPNTCGSCGECSLEVYRG